MNKLTGQLEYKGTTYRYSVDNPNEESKGMIESCCLVALRDKYGTATAEKQISRLTFKELYE